MVPIKLFKAVDASNFVPPANIILLTCEVWWPVLSNTSSYVPSSTRSKVYSPSVIDVVLATKVFSVSTILYKEILTLSIGKLVTLSFTIPYRTFFKVLELN